MAPFWPRKHSLSLVVRKHWMVPSRAVQNERPFADMRKREKTEENKRTWKLNSTHILVYDSGPGRGKKRHY